jgi:hypothetical protein
VSRAHPFELVFAPVAETWFGAIKADAGRSGRSADTRAGFAGLESAQQILSEMAPPDTTSVDPMAAGEYLALLFAGYAFWAAGRYTVTVPRARLERMIETPPAPAGLPPGSGYLQLPEQWFWSQVDGASPHEPLDGWFWTSGGTPRELTVVAVLGLRRERPGFSQLSLTAVETDLPAAAQQLRDPPFAPLMEGGDRAGFRSLRSTAELLWLTHLALSAAGE